MESLLDYKLNIASDYNSHHMGFWGFGVSQWMKLGLPLILIPYAAIFHAKGNSLWLNAQSTHFIRFMGRWDVCVEAVAVAGHYF